MKAFQCSGLVLGLAMLAGCGGGSEGATAGPSRPDGPGSTTPLVNSVCSDGTAGASNDNTCQELERIGALALTQVRMSSLAFSAAYDRAVLLPTSGAQDCPSGGTVTRRVEDALAIRLTYQLCDFGLGPFSGTVRTEQNNAGDSTAADIEVDVRFGAVRYEGSGYVVGFGNTGPQASVIGSITSGSDTPLVLEASTLLDPQADGSYGAALIAQHRRAETELVGLYNTSPDGAERVRADERGRGFVIVTLPFSGAVRYRRHFVAHVDVRSEEIEGRLTVEDRALSGPMINLDTTASENVSSTWDEVSAHPRFDVSS